MKRLHLHQIAKLDKIRSMFPWANEKKLKKVALSVLRTYDLIMGPFRLHVEASSVLSSLIKNAR